MMNDAIGAVLNDARRAIVILIGAHAKMAV
jgi:hypothetical protein